MVAKTRAIKQIKWQFINEKYVQAKYSKINENVKRSMTIKKRKEIKEKKMWGVCKFNNYDVFSQTWLIISCWSKWLSQCYSIEYMTEYTMAIGKQ